jgi:hypothetical protein
VDSPDLGYEPVVYSHENGIIGPSRRMREWLWMMQEEVAIVCLRHWKYPSICL